AWTVVASVLRTARQQGRDVLGTLKQLLMDCWAGKSHACLPHPDRSAVNSYRERGDGKGVGSLFYGKRRRINISSATRGSDERHRRRGSIGWVFQDSTVERTRRRCRMPILASANAFASSTSVMPTSRSPS